MDAHLRPTEQSMAVRALVTVRNDGKAPILHIPLQISSTLNWERVRSQGRDAVFEQATLNSDADHTGQLHEAAVVLSSPLSPGQTMQFDVTYAGTVPPDARGRERPQENLGRTLEAAQRAGALQPGSRNLTREPRCSRKRSVTVVEDRARPWPAGSCTLPSSRP